MVSEKNGSKGSLIVLAISFLITLVLLRYFGFFARVNFQDQTMKSQAEVEAQRALAAGANVEVNVDVTTVKDPWVPSDPLISRGKKVYAMACAMCHGSDGKGDGPAGGNLNPKPRDLAAGQWKKSGDRLGLFDVISNGLPPSSMAGFMHLPISDRWALVHFVRSITQNKVTDDDQQVAEKAPSLQ
jgi:mono/diheme cytochrome c family protein